MVSNPGIRQRIFGAVDFTIRMNLLQKSCKVLEFPFDLLDKKQEKEKSLILCILVFLCLLCAMLPDIISNSVSRNDTNLQNLPAVALAYGLAGVLIFKYLYVPLLHYSGKLLKGSATRSEVETATAFSLMPALINLVIFPVMLAIAIRKNDFSQLVSMNHFLQLLVGLLVIRNFMVSLARFNRFGYFKAALNLLFTGAAFQLVIWLVKFILKF